MEQTAENKETTLQEAVEQSKVEQAPVQNKEQEMKVAPIAMIPHIENTYTFSFNDINLIKQALAPFEYVLGIINSTKQRTDNQPNGSVPVFETDIVKTKDAQGNEVTNLKDPVKFWEAHKKLKGNAMKVENGQLKTNEVYTDLEKKD